MPALENNPKSTVKASCAKKKIKKISLDTYTMYYYIVKVQI